MKYPEELDSILKKELSYLIDKKRAEEGPFAKGVVEKYYDLFEGYLNVINYTLKIIS